MDDDGSNLVFDFESTLEARSDSLVMGSASDALGPAMVRPQHDQGRGSGSFRQIVCRHWLRGLCMKGESCGYLHQYDQDRLLVCHFFRAYGFCRAQDCIFKHNAEDIKECSMYNMGFCPNGPGCQYRHVKKPGPPPPVEEVVKKLQQMNSLYYGSSSGIYQPSDNNNNQQEKPPVQHGSVLKNQNLVAHATPVMEQRAAHLVQTAHPQHVPPPHIQQQQQQHAQVQGVPNGSSNQATITASPLPQGQSRYSIVKSCNRENLEKSVQQGLFGGYIGGWIWIYAHRSPMWSERLSRRLRADETAHPLRYLGDKGNTLFIVHAIFSMRDSDKRNIIYSKVYVWSASPAENTAEPLNVHRRQSQTSRRRTEVIIHEPSRQREVENMTALTYYHC